LGGKKKPKRKRATGKETKEMKGKRGGGWRPYLLFEQHSQEGGEVLVGDGRRKKCFIFCSWKKIGYFRNFNTHPLGFNRKF
jgi:hypothetical protein